MFRLTDDEFNNPSIDTLAILPPNVRDDILRNAIKNNNTKIVQLALELGCDPNISFEYKDVIPDGNELFAFSPSALDVAMIQKHPLLFKHIYAGGGKFNMKHRGYGNRDIMRYLCKDDNFSCLSVLVSELPHIDSPFSSVEETLLSSAASIHNFKAIEFLLAHGADINGRLHIEPLFYPKRYVYNSAISMVYAYDKIIELLEFLQSLGANIEGTGDEYSYPYEIVAYKTKEPDILTYFLNKGVDLKKPNRDALISAAISSLNNVTFLIDIGHSVDVTGKYGETPLDMAIYYRKIDIMKFLLSKSAPFNYKHAVEKLSDSPELLNLIK